MDKDWLLDDSEIQHASVTPYRYIRESSLGDYIIASPSEVAITVAQDAKTRRKVIEKIEALRKHCGGFGSMVFRLNWEAFKKEVEL